jgi:hypothetical protein
MNNPAEILHTLDRHLAKTTELTLFGRAALALGFPDAPLDYAATHDVDGIIPVTSGEPDMEFWLAQQATNEELKNRGLYITHLFSETDVILQPDLKRLRLFRPATIDLILTKMARGDEQDLEDIRFLLGREPTSPTALKVAFSRARIPEVNEIRQLFLTAQPLVLQLAQEISK